MLLPVPYSIIPLLNWMGNCYGWKTWCHMNCCISFISRFSMHIHNMKIICEMDDKFFGVKKKLISISLIAYAFSKAVMFIVHCICSALSSRLSAQFRPQLPCGCFTCCCLNVSFMYISLLKPKTLPAVSADLVNPWLSRNISAYFWRCDVFCDVREIAYYSCYHTQEQRLFCTSDCWHCQNKAATEICKLYKI